MRRRRNVRRRLGEVGVPPHRPGFWEDLEAELAAVDAVREAGGDDGVAEVVSLREQRERRQRVAPWVAASAAAVVVLALGGATAWLSRSDPQPEPPAAAGVTPTVGEGDTFSGREVPAPTAGGPAPWSAPSLDRVGVPEVLYDVWEAAENQRWCSALAPVALPAAGADALPRAAEFGGGWAVAWDRPDGPGQQPDGSDCPDCGRSAYGVAGTGVTHDASGGGSRTATISWSDGSFASIAPEGDDAAGSKLLADLVVAEQGCVYQLWSNLGEAHLRELLGNLRFVQGLEAAPVALRTASDQPEIESRQAPPWRSGALDAAAVDGLVFEQWRLLDIAAPQLYLADLDATLDGAEIRTWSLGIAWDRDAGPGHDSRNQPCTECGRGVVGIGWRPVSDLAGTGIPPPHRIEWEDGSYAEYGGRLADPALPRDRVVFFDPMTGEATIDALQAVVHVAGADYEVVVWSHLGEDHLLGLIDRLRWVDPVR